MVIQAGIQQEPLSKQLENVDEAEVLYKWFGIEKVPCLISSPFRNDNNPSFSVRYDKKGRLKCHDFATGESFSVTDMVMRSENCDFKTAARMILGGKYGSFVSSATEKPRPAKPTEIEFAVRPWNGYDIDFWGSYGISQRWCDFAGVYPVSGIVFKSDGYVREMAAEMYAYAFVTFFEGHKHTKIYQPHSKTRKWMNDGDGITQVWNLLDKLPEKGENLIITSSLKDALCLWANTGIPACCPQSESANLDEKIVEGLKKRFDNVWVFYDNDYSNPNNPGQTGAKKACDKFGLGNIVIESWYECKDPSDLYKRYGGAVLRRIVTKTTSYETHKLEIGQQEGA